MSKNIKQFIASNTRVIFAVLFVVIIVLGVWIYNASKTAPQAEAAWFNDAWLYRTKLTVDHTKIDEDLSSFPVAVHLNSDRITYANAGEGGQDVRFTTSDGTELNYEIESWNTSGTSTIWVNIPGIDSNADTPFYMYYGNSSATSTASSTLVWDDNYKMVQHMNQAWDAAANDSTSNNNDGTNTNFYSATSSVDARIDGGIDFDGEDDYVDLGAPASLDISGSNPRTVSAWVRIDSAVGQAVIVSAGTGGARFYALLLDPQADQFTFYVNNGCGAYSEERGDSTIYTDIWYHVVGVFDGSNQTIYLNGAQDSDPSAASPSDCSLAGARIGNYAGSAEFPGAIDEVRVSNNARSVAWIKADYNSGQDTLLSYGTEEIGSGPVGYWSFDEGFGTTAFNSANATGTDGVINGGALWKSEEFCVSGKCLEFDGTDDYVDMGDIDLLDGISALTYSVWVKPSSPGTLDNIVGKWDSSGGDGLTLHTSNSYGSNDILWGGWGGNDFLETTGDILPNNKWTHVVGVFDGTKSGNSGRLKLYINAQEIEAVNFTGTIPATTPNTSYAVQVGDQPSGGRAFPGFIDELKIYPRALSADEIKAEYNARGSTKGLSFRQGQSLEWMSDGLVGYWPMDESASSTCATALNDSCDFSGLGNDGNWFPGANSATATTTAKFGRAVEVDGSEDYVDIGTNLEDVDLITVAFWARPDVSQNSKEVVARNSLSSTRWEVGTITSTDRWQANIQLEDNSLLTAKQTGGGSDLTVGAWQHVAFSWDGETLRLYVDGQQTAIAAGSGNLRSTAGLSTYFGSNPGGSGSEFDGAIDEVRIYNRALSPAEVKKLYEWAPGPVAHWTMDEKVSGDSQTIYNYAATSTNGLLDGTTNSANGSGMDCTVRGKYGGACEFDGVDDRITISSDESFDTTGPVTYAAWIKRDVGSNIITKQGPNSYSPAIQFYLNSQSPEFRVRGNGGDLKRYADFGVFDSSDWAHFAVTWDGGEEAADVHIYVNGVEVTYRLTLDAIDIYDSSGKDMYIGNIEDFSGGFDGLIDDVRIYNYILTPKQIINIMNARPPWAGAVGSPVGSQMGWWKFDEGFGTTAFDSSPQGNDGTYTGNASSTPFAGKIGRGMALDGTGDYVSVVDSAGISFAASDLSLSAWVNPTSLASESTILAKNSEYRIVASTLGNLGCQINNGTDWQSAATSTTAISTSAWQHVACTYDGTSLKIFINGQEEASQALSSMSNDTTNALRIGSDASSAFADFNGYLDEVKIYNYALSEEEIKLEFNQGKSTVLGSLSTESDGITPSNSQDRAYCVPGDTSTCRAPVGEWLMEDRVTGASQTIRDTSGHGNDGTTSDANGSGMDCNRLGKVGRACEFDGVDDYVEDSSFSGVPGYPFTLSAWSKITDDGSIFSCVVCIGGDLSSQYFGIGWALNGSNAGASLVGRNTTFDQFIDPANSGAGAWHHITGIFLNETSRELFVDGVSVGTDTSSVTELTNPSKATIGDTPGGGIPSLGIIDQVRIYDYARTPAQIAWEYNRGAPVGWWKLDECQGSTIYDSSGNKNHGTITIGASGDNTTEGTCTGGTGAWGAGQTGKRNSSLDFDGIDDYVEVLDDSAISFANSTISFGAWVNPGTVSGDDAILAKNNEYRLVMDTNGLVGCNIYNGTDWQTSATSTTVLVASTWKQVTCTYDGATLKVYVDGQQEGSTSVSNVSNDTTNALRLADDTSSAFTNFDGQIDDVRIYNYALTPLQVQSLYNNGAVNFAPITGSP